MSSRDLAIAVRDLGKAYDIGQGLVRSPTFRDALMERLRNPLRRVKQETLWALKDLNLDIHQGDVVGIIGRNGAGKSTLLKVLSRITEPTEGQVNLYGRVGSLLEVGTGFHPELTGRENIYLNGSILGMRKKEIDRQFDAIVDFAEVEKFLETPVKRYSSGMYVRLAFAVAAHLDPEILIVDEVLAVGDSQFQNKCLGKMGEVARSGRTVLLVSHNMAAVSNLCTTAIVLQAGKVVYSGDTTAAIEKYMQTSRGTHEGADDFTRRRPAWAKPIIMRARTIDSSGQPCTHFHLGGNVGIEMEFDATDYPKPLMTPVMGVVIRHPTLGVVGGVNMRMTGTELPRRPYTRGTLRCELVQTPLLQGAYSIDLWLGDGPGDIDTVSDAVTFEIEASDIYGTGATPFRTMGTVFLHAKWDVSDLETEGPSPALSREVPIAAS